MSIVPYQIPNNMHAMNFTDNDDNPCYRTNSLHFVYICLADLDSEDHENSLVFIGSRIMRGHIRIHDLFSRCFVNYSVCFRVST